MHISELIYKKHKIFRPREKYEVIYIKNLEMMEKYQGKFHVHLLVTMGTFYFGRHFSVCRGVHFQLLLMLNTTNFAFLKNRD